MNRHGKRCTRGSKVGTTSAVVIAASVTARQCATSYFMKNKPESASLASCPPPADVVVVIGDPPTGCGQPSERRPFRNPRTHITKANTIVYRSSQFDCAGCALKTNAVRTRQCER